MRPDVPAEPHARTSRPRLRSPRCPSRQVRTDSLQVRRRKHRTRALLPGRGVMGVECPSPHRGKAGHADLEKALDMRGFGSCRRVTEVDFHIGTHRDQAFEECDCPGLRHATLEGAVESRGNVQSMNRPVGMAASRRAYSSADSSGYRVRGGRTNDNRDEV